MLNFLLLGLLVIGFVAISGCADNATEQVEETVNETVGEAVNATEQVMNETAYPAIVEAEETVGEILNETAEAVNETLNETSV